jgi:hypothetical protein
MTIFQYFIGNTDYSIAGRHNVKLIKEIDPFKKYPVPVPYDFDYAGIVNTHYAVPTETLGTKNVTERYFLGPCRTDKEYNKALLLLLENKYKIIKLIEEFQFLNKKDKNEMVKYLTSFYERVDMNSFIPAEILSTCKDPPTK